MPKTEAARDLANNSQCFFGCCCCERRIYCRINFFYTSYGIRPGVVKYFLKFFFLGVFVGRKLCTVKLFISSKKWRVCCCSSFGYLNYIKRLYLCPMVLLEINLRSPCPSAPHQCPNNWCSLFAVEDSLVGW